MKASSIGTITLLALSTLVHGQTVGIAEFKGETSLGGGRIVPSHLRVLVGNEGFRIELELNMEQTDVQPSSKNPGGPVQARTVIVTKLAEANKLYLLNDNRRSFAILEASKTGESNKDAALEIKRLGRDTVAGLSCERALVISRRGSEIEVCVTREVGTSGTWADALNGSNPNVYGSLRANELEGFPIKWLVRSGGEKFVTSFELVRFERRSVPASALEIPAGYKKTDSMGVWASPEQERAVREAHQRGVEQMPLQQREEYRRLDTPK
jgi:hypothetical protein